MEKDVLQADDHVRFPYWPLPRGWHGRYRWGGCPAGRFVNPGAAVIVDVCKKVFPVWSDWTSKWSKIAKRALADVVHHREWIITNKLSVSTTSALFTAPGLLTSLSSQLGDINGDGLARHGVDVLTQPIRYISLPPPPTSHRPPFCFPKTLKVYF